MNTAQNTQEDDLGATPVASNDDDSLGATPVDVTKVSASSPSAEVFRRAVVPGHPLDTMINGLRAMALWGGENKGVIGDMAVKGGFPAIGQRVGGPIGGAVGGVAGDIIAQARNIYTGKQQKFEPGEVVAAGVVGAVPGKSTKNAEAKIVAMEAGWQGLTNLAAEVVQTGIDQRRMPTRDEMAKAFNAGALSVAVMKALDAGKLAAKESIRKGENSYIDETFINAHNKGYLLDPEISNPNNINKAMTTVAGESQLQAAASEHNRAVTKQLAREQLGVQPGESLDPLELRAKEYDAAKPYRSLARVSPAAEAAVATWKKENFAAKRAWKSANLSGNPDHFEFAEKAELKAQAAFDIMEQEAKRVGNPGMLSDIQEARKELAIIHTYDSAMNYGTGMIDPTIIGRIFNSGAKLTGNLEIIGRFQKAQPQVMGSPTQASTATRITRLGMYGGGIAGGAVIGGGAGAAIGAGIGAVSPYLARKTALSKGYQALNYLPKYSDNADTIANAARFATQSAGR